MLQTRLEHLVQGHGNAAPTVVATRETLKKEMLDHYLSDVHAKHEENNPDGRYGFDVTTSIARLLTGAYKSDAVAK